AAGTILHQDKEDNSLALDTYERRTGMIENAGKLEGCTGSNCGLYQFGPKEMKEFGITNWRDPDQQNRALRQERARNRPLLEKALGRAPTPGEEYIAHQQGQAGGPALLSGDPNEPAWKAIRQYYSSDYWAKKAISGNILHDHPLKRIPVENVTKGQFTGMWIHRFERGGINPSAIEDYIASNPHHGASSGLRSEEGHVAKGEYSEDPEQIRAMEQEEVPRFKARSVDTKGIQVASMVRMPMGSTMLEGGSFRAARGGLLPQVRGLQMEGGKARQLNEEMERRK